MISAPNRHDAWIERIHSGEHAGRLWRISPVSDWREAATSPSAARWHTRGADVLYTSTSEALAALEALAHLAENPKPHRLLSFDFPAGTTLRIVEPATLPRDWTRNKSMSRRIGDAWLRGAASDLLWVPSVHAMHSGNVLFNPALGKVPTTTDHGVFRFNVRLRRLCSSAPFRRV